MMALRIISTLMLIAIGVYTGLVIATEGWDFLSVFINNFAPANWTGQFQMDFTFYLILASLWIAWRYQFSAAGIALGLISSMSGMLFFAPYLLAISFIEKGDISSIVLGPGRSA